MRNILRAIPIIVILLLAWIPSARTHADDGDFGPLLPADHQELLSTLLSPPDAIPASVAGPSSPTGTGHPPRVGPNEQVNAPQFGPPHGLFGRSETSIASTADGQLAVAGFNDAQGFCGPPFGAMCTPESPSGLSGYAFSTDGGLTWTDGGAPPSFGSNVFTRGDPWLDRGGLDNATFYFANLAVDSTTGASFGVSVHRGHFSGTSFSWQDVHTFNTPNAPNDAYDKEALVAAKDGSGAAYVSVTNFIETCGQPANGFGRIEVWRTHDGGDTWQGPTVVSQDETFITDPSNPACGTTGTLQQSSVPAIGPNGEVYVTWSDGPSFTSTGVTKDARIMVARSLDGGVTFSTPMVVATTNSMRQNPPVGYNRNRFNDHPRIAVATSGPHKGRVYLTYYSAASPVGPVSVVSCPSGTPSSSVCIGQNVVSSQVFLTFSDDGGQSWSTPAPVASSESPTGTKRFWPDVGVEPGGNVDIVYLESQETTTASNPNCIVRVGTVGSGSTAKALRRAGPANSLVNTFEVQSTDGGATFSAPVKLTSATSDWCTAVSNVTPNFGDYIGAAEGGNRLLATWGDARNGVPDVFQTQFQGAGKSP